MTFLQKKKEKKWTRWKENTTTNQFDAALTDSRDSFEDLNVFIYLKVPFSDLLFFIQDFSGASMHS